MKKQHKQKVVKGLPLFSLDTLVGPLNTMPERKKVQKDEDSVINHSDK